MMAAAAEPGSSPGERPEDNRLYQEVPLLEKELQDYLKAPFVKAHMNGTSALMSMFFALDLPAGSEITMPSYTAWATVAPMHFFGYVPIFIDINPRTACFDVEYAARHLTSRTRAVLPLHSFGLPYDMDHICAFAKKHGLAVVKTPPRHRARTCKASRSAHGVLHRRWGRAVRSARMYNQ